MYKLSVYIGRFQPFHVGHKSIVEHALAQSERVLILVGSANNSGTVKNPLSYETRSDLIKKCLSDEYGERVIVAPLNDIFTSDELWVNQVTVRIDQQKRALEIADSDICLVGFNKDASSYYLEMFPHLNHIFIGEPLLIDGRVLSSTDVRNEVYGRTSTAASTILRSIPAKILDDTVLALRDIKAFRDEFETESVDKNVLLLSTKPAIYVAVTHNDHKLPTLDELNLPYNPKAGVSPPKQHTLGNHRVVCYTTLEQKGWDKSKWLFVPVYDCRAGILTPEMNALDYELTLRCMGVGSKLMEAFTNIKLMTYKEA